MTKAIVVTGASGWIGSEVCKWLEGNGHTVLRFTRSGIGPETIAADLSKDSGDLLWRSALNDCSAIVHCAAHAHRFEETAADRPLFESVNVGGTRRMAAACEEAGVNRFVLASSVSVYDWSVGSHPRKEGERLAPRSLYAISKLESERSLQATSLGWCVARIATVYGNGDRANFSRIARALRRRRFVIPGTGSARKSVLPVSMAGELLGRLAIETKVDRVVLNLAAPAAPSLAEICQAFSRECGYAVPRKLPLVLMRSAASIGDLAVSCGGRVPLTSEVLRKLTTDSVVDVSQMQSLFPLLYWRAFGDTLKDAAVYYNSI